MDNTPLQPADDIDILDDLLGRARYFILGLIGFIDTALERLGDTPLNARAVRYLMRRALLPAEAALRRAILLIATTLPPPAPARAQSRAARQPAAAATGKPAAPRAPLFRMSEPQPRPTHYRKTDHLSEDLMPRVTLLTESVLRARPAPAQPPPAPQDPAAAFYRRFQALRAAYNDPAPYARRWLRRRARSAISAAKTLAPVKVPGASRALGENTISLLKDLTQAARARALPNTS